jgi:polysaccharide chain length determinant protein (PEP-CTERM system associated)
MLPGKKYGPEDALRLLWRGKWLLLVCFVVFTASAAGISAALPNRYRSETLILVVPQRVPESYVRSTVTLRVEDRLGSLQQEILSRTRLERVILDLNLYEEERRTKLMEDVVAGMREAIDVETVRGDAFRVSFIAQDAVVAKMVTERLASLFIEENVRDRELLAEGTSEFLQSQLDASRQQLIEQEKKLEDYNLRYAGELPSQASSNAAGVQAVRMQLQAVGESINRDRDRQLMLERQLAELVIPAPQAPAAGGSDTPSVAAQLDAARTTLDGMRGRYTEDHPDVIRQRRIVSQLEAQAAATAPAGSKGHAVDAATTRRKELLQGEIDNLARQITAKHAEQRKLELEMAEYKRRLEAVPVRESELIELTRDYQTLQSQYQALLAKREDSKVAANLERRQVGEQFRVLDPPRVPERPYSPNRPLITMLGAVLGLGLAVGILGLREYLDTSFKTEDEILSHLSLQVIASIPDMSPARSGWFARKRTA